MGTEANLNVGVHRNLWLNLGMDFVDAQDTEFRTPLPRIPPLRGRLGFAWNGGGFRVAPELILASQQHQTFTGETRTPGYSVVNLKASYTTASQHLSHQFSVNVFNIGDRLYRNHSSFIKDLAPEIGRGVRFTYMMRFF
jgi:iron complex outermembrane receptor protein